MYLEGKSSPYTDEMRTRYIKRMSVELLEIQNSVYER